MGWKQAISRLWLVGLLAASFGTWADANADSEERRLCLGFESEPIVRLGEYLVTQADVDAFLVARVPEEDRAAVLMSPDRIGQLLQNLLLRQGLSDRARREGLFDQPLVQAQLIQAVDHALGRIYQEHFQAEIELDSYEDVARELYMTRTHQFAGAPTVDFRHLLIGVEGLRSETEAMKLILELHERVSAGEPIEELAVEYSEDPSVAENGGLFRDVPVTNLVSQVRAVVSETPAGELADPVRSSFGWHLVVPVAHHDPEPVPWEEARDQALEMARNQHRSAAVERLLRDLQDAPPEFAAGSIEQLLRRYGLSGEDAPSIQSLIDEMDDA